MPRIVNEVKNHLEWRQTNIPLPRLNDATLNLLNSGILYLHGRCKDFTPIIVIDMVKLNLLLRNNEINTGIFCSLHNFMSLYAMNNMMLPGQVERWVTVCNINQFPLKEMPVNMFKGAAKELGCNYIDRSSK